MPDACQQRPTIGRCLPIRLSLWRSVPTGLEPIDDGLPLLNTGACQGAGCGSGDGGRAAALAVVQPDCVSCQFPTTSAKACDEASSDGHRQSFGRQGEHGFQPRSNVRGMWFPARSAAGESRIGPSWVLVLRFRILPAAAGGRSRVPPVGDVVLHCRRHLPSGVGHRTVNLVIGDMPSPDQGDRGFRRSWHTSRNPPKQHQSDGSRARRATVTRSLWCHVSKPAHPVTRIPGSSAAPPLRGRHSFSVRTGNLHLAPVLFKGKRPRRSSIAPRHNRHTRVRFLESSCLGAKLPFSPSPRRRPRPHAPPRPRHFLFGMMNHRAM